MNAYIHKDTGMQVKAYRFKYGMQDGWIKDKGTNIPYMKISDNGKIINKPVNEKMFIVEYKGYKFLFEKEYFLKKYKLVKENKDE